MNNINIVEALTQIAREKNVDRELVVQTLADALVSAAKKRYGNTENFVAQIDPSTGHMAVLWRKTAVEQVTDPALELSVEEAQQIDPQAQVGSVVDEKLNLADFGRNAIQTAKQILIQRVREAERVRIFEEFKGRIGQIESGVVQQISHGDIILNLGRAEAAVPLKEQIRRERYRQGDTVRGMISEVLEVSRGPQVLLSRTHPDLLKKLFAIEVPEIAEGIVKIHAVARDPGERAKIAVSSNDDRVDPVGACVGVKGSRVQAIVRELSGERIDIVPWSDEPEIFITRALSPAVVSRVIVDRRRRHAVAIVDEAQLSLAIGKAGQNSRLAVQLTGWGLDIITGDEYQGRRAQIDAVQQELRRLSGVSELIALSLATSGFTSVASVAEATIALLQTVPGLEGDAADQVKTTAQAFMAEEQERAAAQPEPAAVTPDGSAEGEGAKPVALAADDAAPSDRAPEETRPAAIETSNADQVGGAPGAAAADEAVPGGEPSAAAG